MSAKQSICAPINIASNKSTCSSNSRKHNTLVNAILEKFAPHFVPGSVVIHACISKRKPSVFHENDLAHLVSDIDTGEKMPDIVLYDPTGNRLFLVETVSGNGPIDGKRHEELARLFTSATPGLVYVTASPSRAIMARYLPNIAWETEVWVADAPSHLIHFNGSRFLGPYSKPA